MSANRPDCIPRPYDAPGLGPREFLVKIMRDPMLPLSLRIDAASKALALSVEPSPPPYDPDFGVTYKISPWPQ
jgi:hypothetical protein